jgi:2,4-didehydro-3-deoxy-L-rhamnonate hydrolase
MHQLIRWTAGLCLAGLFASAMASPDVAPDFQTVTIAPKDQALTFARVLYNGTPHLISVSSYEEGRVSGNVLIGLDDDPISAFQTVGFDALRIAATSAVVPIDIPASQLLIPVSLGAHHIAAGTNFPEHAEEATVEDGPFLFPKAVQPTGPYANVSAGEGLLDYEVELCFVGFSPIDLDNPPAHVGLFLCNDYTDRAKLMRHIDPFDVTSGQGFTTGKSAPGFMPIGNLFVIPLERETFVPEIELNLYRNGVRQQHAFQRQAVWNFEELLQQIKIRQDVMWSYEGADVGLSLNDGVIPVRTALLGGTPSGTIFQGDISLGVQFDGFLNWLMGGWDHSIIYWVIESVIEQEIESGQFLQPGDEVVIHVDGLGVITNSIVE